jgi:hypothetical protein
MITSGITIRITSATMVASAKGSGLLTQEDFLEVRDPGS